MPEQHGFSLIFSPSNCCNGLGILDSGVNENSHRGAGSLHSQNLVEEVIAMLHRKLGNTGISVGKIALGTMYFGSETPEADAFAILDTFIEAGGNLVDTANVYVNGVSEEIIGRWFAARP